MTFVFFLSSGAGWIAAHPDLDATVELLAIRTDRGGRRSSSVVVARTRVDASATRDGHDLTFRFAATIPVIDTSEGRFSWNVQLETHSPQYRATFMVDVA